MKITALDTPALCIDLDVMERNLRRLASYGLSHSIRLRPHTKTHKIPELAKKQLQLGAVGITVAKLGEAEVMADAGIHNILIAYPLFGEQKWKRLVDLAKRVQVTVALDSMEVARGISSYCSNAGIKIDTLLEFDTGSARCGLPINNTSLCAVREISQMPGLNLIGVLVYPGHFLAAPEKREQLVVSENEKISKLLGLLKAEGINSSVVSGGSTPSAFMTHRITGITEIRSGTYIFNDKNTVGCSAATYDDCAVSILTTVVSTSVNGRAIIDAGSKTFSGDRLLTGDNRGCGYIVKDPDIFFEAMSEEHGHLNLGQATTKCNVGDRIRVIPNHVCACMNMHDTVYGIQGEDVITEFRVAGRGKVR